MIQMKKVLKVSLCALALSASSVAYAQPNPFTNDPQYQQQGRKATGNAQDRAAEAAMLAALLGGGMQKPKQPSFVDSASTVLLSASATTLFTYAGVRLFNPHQDPMVTFAVFAGLLGALFVIQNGEAALSAVKNWWYRSPEIPQEAPKVDMDPNEIFKYYLNQIKNEEKDSRAGDSLPSGVQEENVDLPDHEDDEFEFNHLSSLPIEETLS